MVDILQPVNGKDYWIQTNNKSMMLFRGADRSGSGEDDEQQND